jgi:hypothetical protein
MIFLLYILVALVFVWWGLSFTDAYQRAKTSLINTMLTKIANKALGSVGPDSNMIGNALEGLSKMVESQSQPPKVNLIHRGKVLHIQFNMDGDDFEIHIPYNRNQPRDVTMSLMDNEDNIKLLRYHPCLPVYVTAKQLFGKRIVVNNSETGDRMEYHGNDPVTLG